MDPPLDPPLRLALPHPSRSQRLDEAADTIRYFLQEHAARTGAAPGATSGGDGEAAQASTGGSVVTSQLARLIGGLDADAARKI